MNKQLACTEEVFLKDVATHAMTVELDNGVFRHLTFRRPNTNAYSFAITTWPGHLAISGDMGSWVFSRIRDMLQFFRDERVRAETLYTNPHYWEEKVQAADKGGCQRYSYESFLSHIDDHVKQWLEGEDQAELTEEQADAVAKLRRDGLESEHDARRALYDFDVGGDLQFDACASEWKLGEYTFHYLWACYAIAWAVKQYDASKPTGAV